MSPVETVNAEQLERLALLAEECGEVIQVIGKILRHGHESTHPNGGPDNRELLVKEIGDVLAAIDLITYYDDFINHQSIDEARTNKLFYVAEYLHYHNPLDMMEDSE